MGPQSCEPRVVRELLRAGATGVRLTFSYGSAELQCERARLVRSCASELGVDVVIIADLQGEKCRIACVEGCNEIPVRQGMSARLVFAGAADVQSLVLPLQNPGPIMTIKLGDLIIEGDGAMVFRVEDVSAEGIRVTVQTDGVIRPGRGLLAVSSAFHPNAMTQKDISDLNAVLECGLFDGIAVSFVASPEDIVVARRVMAETGVHLPIIAKIETEQGISNLAEVARAADALMAARGDLALTMNWVELPHSVRAIARAARDAGKPWILATQLMEGLEKFSLPTRAEICDLAQWLGCGAQGVMLSYETAFGSKPVQAVELTRRLVERYGQK